MPGGRESWRRALVYATMAVLVWSAPPLQPPAAAEPPAASQPENSPRLVILGSGGGPLVGRSRMQSGSLVEIDGAAILIDAGSGVLQRLAESGRRPAEINCLLLTHLHIDHIADLWPMLLHRWIARAPVPLRIVGPPGTRAMLDGLANAVPPVGRSLKALGPDLPSFATTYTVEETAGNEIPLVINGSRGNVAVRSVENSHLSEDRTIGQSEPVSLTYRLDGGGRSFLFTGDTGASERVEQLGIDVDVMIGEVVDVEAAMQAAGTAIAMPQAARDQLRERMTTGHLTPLQLGEMARRANARALIVSHIVPGNATPSAADDERLTALIRSKFAGQIIIARDLMTY